MRKLKDMGKEKKELKEKFARISTDFMQKEMCIKALYQHVELLKEIIQKLVTESGNIQVTKQQINAFPIKLQRPKNNGQ